MIKLSHFKYAVFDMDGLMFDTERLLIKAFQSCVSKYADCEFPTKKLTQLLGLNFEASNALFPELFHSRISFRECCNIADYWVEKYITEVGIPTKPGLYELLEWLKNHYFKIAIATSSDYIIVEKYIKNAHIEAYFDSIISGDMVTKSKPDPEIFQKAATSIGCKNPMECIIFEDSENGLLAAANAGMPVIIVPDLTDPALTHPGLCLAKVKTLADIIPLLADN